MPPPRLPLVGRRMPPPWPRGVNTAAGGLAHAAPAAATGGQANAAPVAAQRDAPTAVAVGGLANAAPVAGAPNGETTAWGNDLPAQGNDLAARGNDFLSTPRRRGRGAELKARVAPTCV